MKPPTGRAFHPESRVVMLWQYYGAVNESDGIEEFLANVQSSDLEVVGVRGCEFSCYAAIEGPSTDLFTRMAMRAGSVFSGKEKETIKARSCDDFKSNQLPRSEGKPIFVLNDSPLAIWLNHVLHHLGKTHPRYLPEVRIALDPFAASLSAVDSLVETGRVDAIPEPSSNFHDIHFRVALSFPGERRSYVKEVADALWVALGQHGVFYDNYYQPELARPNLDVLLQRIYHDNSDLIVVFLCENYAQKEWCGLEWRAIRDLIKQKSADKLMMVRFDAATIPGVFGIDGYLDISAVAPTQLVESILRRLESTSSAVSGA